MQGAIGQPPPAPIVTKPAEVVAQPECLCVTYAAKNGVKVPAGWNAEDFKGNTTPHVGALALFKYRNGISHVARIIAVEDDHFVIDQDGVTRCNNPSDTVYWNDPNLTGFWAPASSLAKAD